MAYYIQFHYYNTVFGHINYSIIEIDSPGKTVSMLTVGLNRDSSQLQTTMDAIYVDETDSHYISKSSIRIDSSMTEITQSQQQLLLDRSRNAINNFREPYRPTSTPNEGSSLNCLEGVDNMVRDVVPNYADTFGQDALSAMEGFAQDLLHNFSSNPGSGPTPGGGLDPGFDGAGAGFGDGEGGFWGGFLAGLGALFDAAKKLLSPIVLDLDGGGVQTTPLSTTGTHFDLDVNGFAEATGWVGPHNSLNLSRLHFS